MSMMRVMKVWYHILGGIGPAMRAGRKADQIFRYYVIEALAELGLFNYLNEPRSYGQILTEFDFADTPYVRDMLDILSADKQHILVQENGSYQTAQNFTPPTLENILGRVPRRYHNFTLMAKSMAHSVPKRLKAETVEFSDTLHADGRQYLTMFDKVLADKSYGALRNSAFAILSPEDKVWLRGKKLLDVGCGSGREPADLWLKMDGEIKITGIDPVGGMIEIAQRSFGTLLDELDILHPRLTPENHPEFITGSATRLPFKDSTFDAVFHSQILHWTPDPHKSVAEIARVLKPDGLVFGTQTGKPYANPYFDLLIRTSDNSSGFFWMEEFGRMYARHDINLEIISPAGTFRGRKGAKTNVPASSS